MGVGDKGDKEELLMKFFLVFPTSLLFIRAIAARLCQNDEKDANFLLDLSNGGNAISDLKFESHRTYAKHNYCSGK
ncbi:MAG: hypothetical protein ACHBN1_26995 [Heteroscytonema crispum UTEX LB 1556]